MTFDIMYVSPRMVHSRMLTHTRIRYNSLLWEGPGMAVEWKRKIERQEASVREKKNPETESQFRQFILSFFRWHR